MTTRPVTPRKALNYSEPTLSMIQIRTSTDSDLARITSIYRHHVLAGTGTFEVDPPSEDEMATRRIDVLNKNLPYLVAAIDGLVVGFAYCNWFKPRPAYRYSAEDSIYLANEVQGQGIGRALLSELSVRAETAGIRKLIAVIGDSANERSIGLHHALGFRNVGLITACGWKFDRWLDIVLMEKTLGQGSGTKPEQLKS